MTQRHRSLPFPSRAFALSILAVLFAASGCGDDGEGNAATPFTVPAPLRSVSQPGSTGRFVDPLGREVLLRGVNVNSLGEYWQYDPNLATVFPFGESDIDFVASTGFNLVRLVISWSRVEPRPGVYDEAYLAAVADTIDALWRRSIFTLVDLHQDAWGPTLAARPGEDCAGIGIEASGWDGAPDWATLVDESLPRCVPSFFGLYLRELSPAVLQAWGNFWDNRPGPGGVGLQDRYNAMLRHVALRLAGRPGVMGYDIMNEPNAYPAFLVDLVRDMYPDLLPPEYIPIFRDSLESLADFYVRALAALRDGERAAGVDPRVVLFEPSAVWAILPDGATVRPFTDDPQVAYGPHIYQSGITPVPLDERVVERVRAEAASYGGIPILSGEWGADPRDAGAIGGYFDKMIGYQDREGWSVVLWLYLDSCGDPHHHRQAANGDVAGIKVWGFRDVPCSGPNVPGELQTDLIDRVARPALHRAPGLIDSLEWHLGIHFFTATGQDAPAGNQLDFFLPGNVPPLQITMNGLSNSVTTPLHGGQRITATANGGAWSVRAAP